MTALEKASLNTSVSNRVKLDDKSGAQVHHLLGSPNSLLEGPANPVCTLLTDLKAPQTRTTADRGPRTTSPGPRGTARPLPSSRRERGRAALVRCTGVAGPSRKEYLVAPLQHHLGLETKRLVEEELQHGTQKAAIECRSSTFHL